MSFKLKKELFIGLSLVILVAAIAVSAMWTDKNPGSQHIPAATAVQPDSLKGQALVTHEDIETLKTELENLKRSKKSLEQLSAGMQDELALLRSQLTHVSKEQASVGQSINRISDNIAKNRFRKSSTPTNADTLETLTPEEEDRRAETQSQEQVALLEETIFSEETDPEWTGEAEQALRETFQKDEANGLELVDAECRTTLCRMEMHLDSSTMSPEDAFRGLSHLTPWQGQGFVKIDDAVEGSHKIVIYLSREGYNLPQLSSIE